ncbi:MoaD/ThiS family protein [Pseudomonas sp. 5P_3.1_Bac2]|uniref:MoaD/ThiS family protein n=1 Tax=Pseudomonas sp. 5P_3.1_Bac2 TaxID=2971617 RepID=UPI0021CA57C0|nr:MoaD/ThiS family protein [Pseudomonas sp. 5P_3.1_Bac2]MCU1715758.1 MoaD/ThiS family protein [Pseudomonas sp. 5P_3.1_Bac2]
MIRVQYFARYREVLGLDEEVLAQSFASLAQVREHLLSRGAAWQVLAESSLMCARNQELCSLNEPLSDGDEVAFFPTVTGG